MRLSRIVSLLVAVIMAATLSQALVAPSQAAGRATSHVALKKPKHDLVANATKVSNNHFVLYGAISTYPKVYIFRKIGHGAYQLYRKLKTDNRGRFRTRIYQYKTFRTCFKVGAPETSSYAQTVVGSWCIYTVHGRAS